MTTEPRANARSQRLLLGAGAGLVAAAAGLAVSELVSGYFHQRVSPLIAVSESIIRITPGWVIEHVISVLGHHDKPVLIGLTLFGLAAVSAAVGILALRSVLAAQGVFLLMGVVLVLAVHARLTPSTILYVAPVLGVIVAIGVLAVLAPLASQAGGTRQPSEVAPWEDLSHPPDPAVESELRELNRRRFLAIAGTVAAVAAIGALTGRALARSRAAVEAARHRLRLPISRPTTPPGADLGVNGVAPWVTSAASFYRIDTALAIPQILPDDWTLKIHGLVDRELTITYQDLLDRGLENAWITLCCVSNPVGGSLISNARWSGVRIADLLTEAGVQSDADAVLSTSADDWTAGTPLTALTDDRDAMLAIAMNGEPLTPEHGFPVRMVVPGLYGYVSGTKWVVDLEVTRYDRFSAFWTDRGWSAKGPIKTESRIDVPGGGHLSPGENVIAGVAWAQHTGIARVELKIGDADWVACDLADEPTIDSWRQWSYRWDADPGHYTIAVRATDASGYTQTGTEADVVPDGATGWHTISVDVS
jgi:DMSO/TMAO reductase YedYZ molybdopterin-dependent catalytic subunit